jgi:serine/threonine protein kinase/predicted negative regulator of RcsB-dependent stress response
MALDKTHIQSAEELNEAGINLINIKKFSDALRSFDAAISVNKSYKYAWNNRAFVLAKLKRYNEALESLEHALKIDPGYQYAWHLKGKILGYVKRYEESNEAYSQSIAIDPDFPQAWNDRGEMFLKQGNYQEAVVSFERAIAIDSSFKKAQTNKTKCIELSRINKTEMDLSAIKETHPSNIKQLETKSVINKKKQQLLADAEQFGLVPVSLRVKILADGSTTYESLVKELDVFKTTIKPELKIDLDHTQLVVDEWEKMIIKLTNRGNAHAKDVRLIFSEEFNTKWIKPISIKAGETTSFDIGIQPKLKGRIPLEVTSITHDGNLKDYHETHEFWIEVIEKRTNSSSLVDGFAQKSLTPKQLPSDLFERYTESEYLGKGGFSWVFKAKRKDGKYVAVKIPISMDTATGKSFIAEMQNWTKLSHPNIVRLYDFNIMPMPFFEEELCDSALSDQHKPLEIKEAAWILFNICEGLKFSHDRKIIHLDLKPQNILLKNGVPKISDWGLSRIISESTSTTATSYTPNYASPEQFGKKAKDERTDIWQLGVIFYELMTGVLPFTGDSMVEVMAAIASKNPILPSLINTSSQDVEPMIMKCLEKNPRKRYQSVLELQKDLALYLRITYTESLKMSVTAHDNNRSAHYCGDLVMINMLTGDILSSYKYLLDLVHYSTGNEKAHAQELSEQLKMRMEMGVTEIPDELIQKAEIIVHQLNISSDIKRKEDKIFQTKIREIVDTKERGSLAGKCPLCGSNLVWRQAKKTGEMYKGCTNFDGGCRYQERSY